MVGGSPVDAQVQVSTGADGWGNDVAMALKLCDAWIGREA
jgi:methanogenic corrinoid protein MtbC1